MTTNNLGKKAESDMEDIGRIHDKVRVGKVHNDRVQGIRVTLASAAQDRELPGARIGPLTDIRKFHPYQTQQSLPILGRAKLTLQAEAGATIDT